MQVGTWAGNIMLTHDNDNFPSDVFTVTTALGATITVGMYSNAYDNSRSTDNFWSILMYVCAITRLNGNFVRTSSAKLFASLFPGTVKPGNEAAS